MEKSAKIRGLTLRLEDDFSNIKFSSDSNFIGMIKKDGIAIYEAPNFLMQPVSLSFNY